MYKRGDLGTVPYEIAIVNPVHKKIICMEVKDSIVLQTALIPGRQKTLYTTPQLHSSATQDLVPYTFDNVHEQDYSIKESKGNTTAHLRVPTSPLISSHHSYMHGSTL